MEPDGVGRRFRYEVDSEAALSDERLKHIAHHVDLSVLDALCLAPQHRIVEQVKRFGLELTVELHRVANAHRHHVTSGRHFYRLFRLDTCG